MTLLQDSWSTEECAALLAVAARVVWFQPPETTLADPVLFLCHVMTYGTLEDVVAVRRSFDEAAFRHALGRAPAGVFDPRSWTYWHVVLGYADIPPLPERFAA